MGNERDSPRAAVGALAQPASYYRPQAIGSHGKPGFDRASLASWIPNDGAVDTTLIDEQLLHRRSLEYPGARRSGSSHQLIVQDPTGH